MAFLLLALSLSAQNGLVIHQKDGGTFGYGFEDKPVITYTQSELVLTTAKVQISYPLASLSKFTFEDVETSVESVVEERASLSLSEDCVTIGGAVPESVVFVYGSDGKSVKSLATDADGNLTFSVGELADGVYVIKTESVSFKILKK